MASSHMSVLCIGHSIFFSVFTISNILTYLFFRIWYNVYMKVFRNPLFYLSFLLMGVVGFQFVQLVRGHDADGVWVPPPDTCDAGRCSPSPPLDTSDASQQKDGNLEDGALTLAGLLTVNNLLTLNSGMGQAALRIEGGSSICLPTNAGSGVPNDCRGSWDLIGSGERDVPAPAGDSFWQNTGAGAILYDGSVSMRNALVQEDLRVGGDVTFGGRVSVGDLSPRSQGTLLVEQDEDDPDSGIVITNASSTDLGRIWMDDGKLRIARGATPPSGGERSQKGITIDINGNVGINTAHPNSDYRLDVAGAALMDSVELDDYLFVGEEIIAAGGIRMRTKAAMRRPLCDADTRGLIWFDSSEFVSEDRAGTVGHDELFVCLSNTQCVADVEEGIVWRSVRRRSDGGLRTIYERGENCSDTRFGVRCVDWIRFTPDFSCSAGNYSWTKIAEYGDD